MTTARRRGRSLFWTFAGAFLAVSILGVLLQGVILVGVVRPLTDRVLVHRVDAAARAVADGLAEVDPADAAEIRAVLGEHDLDDPRAVLVVVADGIPTLAEPLSRRVRAQVLEGLGLSRGTVRRWGRGRSEGGPPAEIPRFPRDREWTVVARVPVGESSMEVVGLRLPTGILGWPRGVPRPMLLFLPVAVGLSVAAGLVLLRILLARLRGLERLAVRVAAGDLDARVDDPRGDEIGRLADALDAMAERLAQARDHLEASDRQRRQLLADISHELGTPLTSIRGYAETLLDTEVPDADGRWRADLSRILTEANRLDALIGELFDLTRLEAGAPLETERLDWTSLCRHVVSRLEPRFADAGLALSFHGQTEAWVDADGRRLEQLLENLLTNALRYVPTGGTVEVSLRAGSPHELRVADDGPGIDSTELGQVFDRFYRADPARTTGGTGLGLAIVKEIASRHGGSVRAEACTPEGVAFVVGLPAAGS